MLLSFRRYSLARTEGLPVSTGDSLAGPSVFVGTGITVCVALAIGSVLFGCANDSSRTSASGEPSVSPGGAALGEVCVPYSESWTDYPGSYGQETVVEAGSPSCASDICYVWQFVGRVTCPEGQDEATLKLPPSDPSRCLTPSGEPVTVVVPPEDPTMPPEGHVFCSCRCDTEVELPCTCPEGMVCGSPLGRPPLHCVFPGIAR